MGTFLEHELDVEFSTTSSDSRLGGGPTTAGDVDGDGLGDVLILNQSAADGLGAAYLFRGFGP